MLKFPATIGQAGLRDVSNGWDAGYTSLNEDMAGCVATARRLRVVKVNGPIHRERTLLPDKMQMKRTNFSFKSEARWIMLFSLVPVLIVLLFYLIAWLVR